MYSFKINDFEGPLDLLLHLIKEEKMDIMDIEIEKLTNQYLIYINNMDTIDLISASDYLTMATELTYMKSKLLVPNKTKDDEEELQTAKDDLTNRLIEYQNYKEASGKFKILEKQRQELYAKTPSNLKQFDEGKISLGADVSLEDLLHAFEQFLNRKKHEQPLTTKIATKEITISERTNVIRNILQNKKKIEFFELFDNYTKSYVVVTFLSILEMAKFNELKITQENNFDKIYCEVVE